MMLLFLGDPFWFSSLMRLAPPTAHYSSEKCHLVIIAMGMAERPGAGGSLAEVMEEQGLSCISILQKKKAVRTNLAEEKALLSAGASSVFVLFKQDE